MLSRRTAGRWAALLIALFVCPAHGQVAERLKACAGCHGLDGNSVIPGIPSIAAQPKVFLENRLILMREGMRGTEVMQDLMKGLSDRDIVAIAAHFAGQRASAQQGTRDKALFQRGRALAAKLRCASCHGPDFRGREQMPRLAGQREDFLDAVMRELRDSPRPGSDTMMTAVLYGVSDAEIRALAHFLARPGDKP